MRNNRKIPVMAKFDNIETPVGILKVVVLEEAVHAILWEHEPLAHALQDLRNPLIMKTKQQLTEYFAGTRQIFDLPVSPFGTPFQMQAWKILQEIPYAQTISYGEQASRLGNKNKARAVGRANGRNPISIVIPCHRVIGSQGQLTGFAGGLNHKAWLLAHEHRYRP